MKISFTPLIETLYRTKLPEYGASRNRSPVSVLTKTDALNVGNDKIES
jgi:hypothetical protein